MAHLGIKQIHSDNNPNNNNDFPRVKRLRIKAREKGNNLRKDLRHKFR